MPNRVVVVCPRVGAGVVPGPGLRVEVTAHPDRVVSMPGYVMLPADDSSRWPAPDEGGDYRLDLPCTPPGAAWGWVLGARVVDAYERVVAEIPAATYLLPEGPEIELTALTPVELNPVTPGTPGLPAGLVPWPDDPAFYYVP
jgi:hypothetical protein